MVQNIILRVNKQSMIEKFRIKSGVKESGGENSGIEKIMVQKFMVQKFKSSWFKSLKVNCRVQKYVDEKSGIEMFRVEKDLRMNSLGLKCPGLKYNATFET